MDLLILRPLVIAIIEYSLAIYVYKKGRFIPKTIALFLFFLASYQLGEFLFFVTDDNYWNSVSLFSTTMLPPFGVVIAERLSGKRAFSRLFFAISIIMGALFLLYPELTPATEECNCFVKYDSSNLVGFSAEFFSVWSRYYVIALGYTMLFMFRNIWMRFGDVINTQRLLIGYFLFFPSSYLVVQYLGAEFGYVASVMCAMAIITAGITAFISVNKKRSLVVPQASIEVHESLASA